VKESGVKIIAGEREKERAKAKKVGSPEVKFHHSWRSSKSSSSSRRSSGSSSIGFAFFFPFL
jgi:hypothetical protein